MGGFGGGPPPGGYEPPPGYGPPGMAPMPGPPKRGGISGAAIALIAVVAFVVLFGGCVACWALTRHRSREADEPAPQPVATTPAKPSRPHKERKEKNDDHWIRAERPYVQFHPPAGWSTEITPDKEWGVFKPPARDAVYAFTTFSRPGESTQRLSRAASVLGVTDIEWRQPRAGYIGRDRFSAHMADGSCNFHGPGGYIWYATVNAGTADQMLLIFAVAAGAPKARREEAEAAIESLQRRP